MLQVFRAFNWVLGMVVLGFALLLRAAIFGLPFGEHSLTSPAGPWGGILQFQDQHALLAWVLGSLCIVLIGVVGSFSLNYYRLGSAGMVPAVTAALVGSAAAWWLGYTPYFIAALLLALAAQRLFAGYRYQGAALPVFDCGLIIGAAWLIAPPFLWFALWAAIAISQLRKLKFTDILNLLLGVATLPFIMGIWAFWQDGLVAFRQNLFAHLVNLDALAGFGESWQTLALLALLSGACVGAFGRLTTRRPIQEQRATRMWYTMLAVAWVAVLASGAAALDALALLLYPMSLLLGMWLSELKRKPGNLVLLLSIILILAGYAYQYFTTPLS